MNEFPLQTFIALVKFDRQTYMIEQEISQLNVQIDFYQRECERYEEHVEALKQKVHELQKEVHTQELRMKELDQAQKEKQKKMDALTHVRDYQSLAHEIDKIKKAEHDLEETLLAAWHAFETAQKNYEVQKKMYDEKMAALTILIQEKTEKITLLGNDLVQRTLERASKEINIPEQWLEKYVLMRNKVPNPVVPVIDGSCSACFYRVLQQDLARLHKGAMLQCKDCFRFLYIESSDQQS